MPRQDPFLAQRLTLNKAHSCCHQSSLLAWFVLYILLGGTSCCAGAALTACGTCAPERSLHVRRRQLTNCVLYSLHKVKDHAKSGESSGEPRRGHFHSDHRNKYVCERHKAGRRDPGGARRPPARGDLPAGANRICRKRGPLISNHLYLPVEPRIVSSRARTPPGRPCWSPRRLGGRAAIGEGRSDPRASGGGGVQHNLPL